MTEPHRKGELYVRAANVFTAYYKAEEKYAEDSRGDFHTVGDVAYFDEDGYYYIADRKNDMIISGGMNIYPAEIEAALDESPDVFEVAVIGIPNEEWGESVHAVVVPATAEVTAEAVIAFGREQLAGYKVPAVGRLRRRAPEDRLGQGAEAGAAGAVLGRPGRGPWRRDGCAWRGLTRGASDRRPGAGGATMGTMALRTGFTELLDLAHPIALAPMGGVAGGALAAAVADGGGLGLVGGGRGDPAWVARELAIVAGRTAGRWGVGFLSWSASVEVVEQALSFGPSAVLLSFGPPGALARPVLDAGVCLIIQVTDLAEAAEAVALGADVIVAQGAEAGGHGGGRSTLPFVPAVVDLAGGTPVLAAGGIADGRGLAAALALGAAGALVGTRFEATPEALLERDELEAIVAGGAEDTERGRILDIARGSPWPARYPARTLRNGFVDRWRGREDELARDDAALEGYRAAVARRDPEAVPIWAGEGLDLIEAIRPAAELVAAIAAEAEAAIARAGAMVTGPPGGP